MFPRTHSSFVIKILFVIVLCLLLIGAVVFSLNGGASIESAEYEYANSNSNPTGLVLYSETIPVLAPHTHEDLDSIIDQEHGEIIGLRSGTYVTDRDLWVTKIAWEVENAPIATLHHFIFTKQDKSAILCPNGFSDKEEVLTVGSDTTANELAFPQPYAIFIPRGTPLDLETILHNPVPPFGPGGTYENVRIKLILTIGERPAYKPLELVRLSLEDPACTPSSSTFDVPANSVSFVKSMNSPISSYTFKEKSNLALIGAHTHGWDRGEEVTVYLNGQKLAEFIPKRMNANPWSWATPTKIINRTVQAGDTVTFTATYSNPYDEPLIHEAMGMILLVFTPI
ncbi:hypothetical protein A3C18_04110 [Candidatus Kaiserbacteria bacterium RIFCSPHIGHO2_02_FULL_54_11b]|uniref:Copper type II ascorbate-dependent monooxygenase C-terminal domain-containing protein n=1 Tax=Candidatus Kaiserbacteria bacterium RIFCSPHIGHO2_02_FULL_54_11b TaxID=1798494 RepID=A0A1F6DSS3_9BACT|nr:MAG: hypothetical protein A3C18_04110 [Candidatus Kaiserbacteria bacterium RIFCSPHIGHO2_02_FULL_54_11b]